jgi:hypothetical protein
MSQRADRELDRLLHIARPDVAPDFTDGVMSRIAAADDPMPIAPAIVFPFRGRNFPPPPPPSLFVRTAIVTAPLMAMLALVFVLASTVFTDKGTMPRGPDDSAAVVPGGPAEPEDLAAEVNRLESELERARIAVNAAQPHGLVKRMRRCSSCHEMARLASFSIPGIDVRTPAKDSLEIVAFVDLEAKGASDMMLAIETMALKFADKVSIEIRSPRTNSAAARASLAAAQQGAYWQMVECLEEKGTATTGIAACADEAKIDRVLLERRMQSPEVTLALDADAERARDARVAGPAIQIGDRVFSGPRAHADARDFVNAALARRML